MPCYHPLIRIEDKSKWMVAKDGHRYHPGKVISQESLNDLEHVHDRSVLNWMSVKQTIPCGNCIGCRLDYSREWANRGYLESLCYKNNWFVTITYNEKHLPKPDVIEDNKGITWADDGTWEGGTLVPYHLKKFFHDLRQNLTRQYEKDMKLWKENQAAKKPNFKRPKKPRFRYMACGEYGSKGARPHYHIIFFNLRLPINDLYNVRIINNEYYYQSHTIEKAWTKGISNISVATWNTIAYTARYITKKVNGEGSDELYKSHGKIKEFMRVSRMPGIGHNYYQRHKKEIYANDSICIKNKKGVVHSKPPTYFDTLYKEEYPEEFERIQKNRRQQQKNADKIKSMDSTLLLREQLEIDERAKESQSVMLRRQLEKKGTT